MPDTHFEYGKLCFVIMPFGKKKVTRGSTTNAVDFDAVYRDIFKPAIDGIPLPEGGTLVARRADDDRMAGLIGVEMYNYIEYSRFAVADISTLGANVFLELGQRFRARESGTAVFRQTNVAIPFDINQVRSLEYHHTPKKRAAESREFIREVLVNSLEHNRIDSPVWEALRVQRTGPSVDDELRQADASIARQDWASAEQFLRQALQRQPRNAFVHFRIGLMRRDQGRWSDAIESFSSAIQMLPDYADAHRELGIAQNMRFRETNVRPDGIEELQQAIKLGPRDYDALASLGGALARAGKPREALEQYRRAVDVSLGHPYPLLNAMRLETILEGKPAGGPGRELQLKRAERFRRPQAEHDPPIDAPWCFFDLAVIQLYLGRLDESLRRVDEGLLCCTQQWQARTFRESLGTLASALPAEGDLSMGVQRIIERLRETEAQLPG